MADLITTQQIVNEVIANKTMDQTLIGKDILLAEERYIKSTLGKDLYEKLRAGSLDSDHQTLLDEYVIPALARFVVYEAMPQLHINITSAGLMVNNTEFSDQASSKAVATARNNMLSKAEHFLARMVTFIKDEKNLDSTKFPDFKQNLEQHRNKFGIILYD